MALLMAARCSALSPDPSATTAADGTAAAAGLRAAAAFGGGAFAAVVPLTAAEAADFAGFALDSVALGAFGFAVAEGFGLAAALAAGLAAAAPVLGFAGISHCATRGGETNAESGEGTGQSERR
jgi:hypothetical protein